jgi:hypothetical protein
MTLRRSCRRGRWPQPGDQRQNVGEHLPRHRDFGHLEGDVAAVTDDLRADLDSFSRRLVSAHGSAVLGIASVPMKLVLEGLVVEPKFLAQPPITDPLLQAQQARDEAQGLRECCYGAPFSKTRIPRMDGLDSRTDKHSITFRTFLQP